MLESSLLLTMFLLALAVFVSIEYHRRIKSAQDKYVEAKNVVSDVVISFNRQLDKQERKISAVAHKAEAAFFRSERLESRVNAHDKRLEGLRAKLEGLENLKGLAELKDELTARIERLNKRVRGLEKAQRELAEKLKELEKAYEAPIEVRKSEAPVAPIPIKKEKALSRLTETELMVLEILADEGKKTAPEIKDRIKLTREHTARLMKKLYEEGYLERSVDKIPFTYRLKEEMRRLLKKPEQKAS